MNYNEMTAQQCADWLAEKDGWKIVNSELPPCSYWWNESTQQQRVLNNPPYKLTLDAAAGALRDPWMFVSLRMNRVGWAFVKAYNATSCLWLEIEGPDELTARYRAAVAARMEDDK